VLSDLTISGFRCFRELRVPRLTRVNLFVGTNNAGKTSILEAAEILTLGKPEGLPRSPRRRGERLSVDREDLQKGGIDPSHLFFGHSLQVGTSFSIRGGGIPPAWFHCQVTLDEPEVEGSEGFEPFPGLDIRSQLGSWHLDFSLEEGLIGRARLNETTPLSIFLGTTVPDLGELWGRVVLTPEEDQVTSTLRIIDPQIERIAFVGDLRVGHRFFVRLSGSEQRLPLGSVGDGLKRLLALALHLVSAQGGYLLVDEIDTGLHHTVMVDMWRLVIETAKRLDIQVLATTHSLDCVRALAWVQEQSPDLASEVTLHRVEKDTTETVAYSMEELAIAARHHLEVR
jgi:AAA domain, putative AbiEii toxin, Type IV TA system/AAA ATPase domain